MITAQSVLEESRQLISSAHPKSVQLSILAETFMQRRLQNSLIMEGAKNVALEKLLQRMDDPDPENQMKPGALMNLIEQFGAQTSLDLKAIMAAQTAAVGNRKPGSESAGFFGGGAAPAQEQDTSSVPRSVYKLLDSLEQITSTIVAKPRTVDAEVVDGTSA